MLETIEKLEKDIDLFHKNVTSSNELHKHMESLVKTIGDQSKLLDEEFESIKKLIDSVPSSVKEENETIMLSYIEKFSSEQAKVISSFDETREELNKSIVVFNEKYNHFLEKLESTNMDQIYRLSVETKKSLEMRTLIIAAGLIFVVVLNIAILILK